MSSNQSFNAPNQFSNKDAMDFARASANMSSMTLDEAIDALEDSNVCDADFWSAVAYSRAVLQALAGEDIT